MKFLWIVVIFLFTFLFSPDAYAYLDPGTGSYMLQILLGVFVGGFFAIKHYWQRLINFFKTQFRKKDE